MQVFALHLSTSCDQLGGDLKLQKSSALVTIYHLIQHFTYLFDPAIYLFNFWIFYDVWIFVNEAVVFNLVCKTVAAVSKIMHIFS